jgi:hypothetical protein
MIKIRKMLIPVLLVAVLLNFACVYVVLPEGLQAPETDPEGSEQRSWNAVVTNVETSEAGDLHVDITIRNDTGEWSTMQAVANEPATLTTVDGKVSNCETVFISTGGHRLAPWFSNARLYVQKR